MAGASLRFARSAGVGVRRSCVATCVTAFALTGCPEYELPEPLPDPEITIALGQGRLCAGMHPWVDAEIERVQDHVGLPLERSLFVELGEAAVIAGCGDAPDDAARLGCTVGTGQNVRVYTRPEALSHELVHALRRQWELKTVPFLEEGWAETVAGSDVMPSIVEVDPRAVDVDLEALLGASADEMRDPAARAVAVHVVRFIEAAVGPEQLAAFFRGGLDGGADAARVRIEAMLGIPWATWATRWSAEALPVAGRGDPCAAGVTDVPADGITLSTLVDCDAADTFGIAGDDVGAWTRQCVRVDAPGLWDAHLSATDGRVRIAAVPGTCEVETPSTAIVSREIEAGAARSTELGACTYTVVFEVIEDVPTAMVLTLLPSV